MGNTNWLTIAKDVAAALKEWLILVVMLVIVLFPRKTVNYLGELGFSTIKTPIGDIDPKKLQEAGGNVDAARRSVADATAALQAVVPSLPEDARNKVSAVATDLGKTEAQLGVPARVLTSAATRTPAEPAATASRTGWI